MENGALFEVKQQLNKGYAATDPGLKTIGYQELIPHILGKYSIDRATELWKIHELQYAKRQKTYLKKLSSLVQNTKDIVY